MSAAGAVPAALRRRAPFLRGPAPSLRTLRTRPTFAVEIGVALAWIAILALLWREALARAGDSTSALWWCSAGMGSGTGAPGNGGSVVASAVAGMPMWTLVVVAMMLPAALPAVEHVAVNSLSWRRRRAMAEFLAVYLGIWIAFGALVLGALALLPRADEAATLAGALALAAAWQLTLSKRRALRACHRSSPLPLRGWQATAGVLRFGLRNGSACLGSCWAMMLVMAVAGSGQLLWMVGLTAIVSAEKLLNKPGRVTRRAAALLGAAALGAVGLAVVA